MYTKTDHKVVSVMLSSIVGGQSLISKLESEESKISEAEAKEFSSGEATQADEEPEEEEDSEDLVSIFVNINISGKFCRFCSTSVTSFLADGWTTQYFTSYLP